MQRWNIIFYPIGVRHSPENFLRGLSLSDVASIQQKLRVISELEASQWPSWIKMVQGIYQLRSGDFRLYFGIDGRTIIVVCHICRKVSQQARQEDIDWAKTNLKHYFETRKKP